MRTGPLRSLAGPVGLLVVLAVTATGFTGTAAASTDHPWVMEDCEGLATLALAPYEDVQATLPPGYAPMDAAVFLGADAVETGAYAYVGVEIWQCASVTLGGVTVTDTLYGSSAAVIAPPEGAPDATMYFYKYGNFFEENRLVKQSERLGAPAEHATDARVDRTLTGATGSVTLASGGTYTLTTADLGTMDAGSFQEWHEGPKGTSHWQAAFTLDYGMQGAGTLTAPAGTPVARAMGGTSGEGLGITAVSTFHGTVSLNR